MVVSKIMRWHPWSSSPPPLPPPKPSQYEVKLTVTRIEGLPFSCTGDDEVAVRIRKDVPKTSGLLGEGGRGRKKKKKKKGEDSFDVVVTAKKAVERVSGTVEFDDEGFGFGDVRSFSVSELGSGLVCFSVMHRDNHRIKGHKERKLEEIGKKSVDLAEWLRHSQSRKQQNGKDNQLQVLRQRLPVILVKGGSTSEAILYVDASFVEVRASEETSKTLVTPVSPRVSVDSKEGETTDDSLTFEPYDMDLYNLLTLADKTEKVANYSRNRNRNYPSSSNSSNSNEESSPEKQFRSPSKRRFLSWGKSKKITSESYHGKDKESRETQSSSPNYTSRELEEDPVGRWESREFISRDKQTKLKSQTFFASIDQRDESAGGESACTALVALIAHKLHWEKPYVPTRSGFDELIREGSWEWRELCNDPSYIDRFPNKHFDLDTILSAKLRPISVLHDKSFIGFFQPESFESLRGAMNFDDIWNEATSDVSEEESRIYIVSWNDHFFVLKVECEACYIIDTLGERLFEGCRQAYILKFDNDSEMYKLSQGSEKEDGGDEVICIGKECCREFIKRFLAAITLREELEVEERGTGFTNIALHQRLQIEFHLTEVSSPVVFDNVDDNHLSEVSCPVVYADVDDGDLSVVWDD